jgi:transcriptional antiterminator NusG
LVTICPDSKNTSNKLFSHKAEYWLTGLPSGIPVSITKKETDAALSGKTAKIYNASPYTRGLFSIYSSFLIIGSLLKVNNDLLSIGMNYYAIQVKTRGEEIFIKLFNALYPETELPLYFPQRRIDIRRRGVIRQETAAVFPGYVFIEAEADDILAHQWEFRRTGGFYRFLRSNQEIMPLANRDLELVLHFIKKVGPIAGISRVYFNEDSRIVVMEGPLMGLEGRIIKVDKRKKRAKVKLDLYKDSFSVDLAFEEIGTLNHY